MISIPDGARLRHPAGRLPLSPDKHWSASPHHGEGFYAVNHLPVPPSGLLIDFTSQHSPVDANDNIKFLLPPR